MIRSKVKQAVSTFYFLLLRLFLSLQFCSFFCTRAPALFSDLSLFLIHSLFANASKADTRSTNESMKTKQKKTILHESHTLVCLNDLFSFCHFSFVVYCVCMSEMCVMCVQNKCELYPPNSHGLKLNVEESEDSSLLLSLVSFGKCLVYFYLFSRVISTVCFACTPNNDEYK